MRAATVEDIAQEFMRIMAEGWTPDPEEFLHRVPEGLREECRARLDELLGPQVAETPIAEEPETQDVGEEMGEMIVFDLDGDGPIQSVRAPTRERGEPAFEAEDEPETADLDEAREVSEAVALEAALEPEMDEAELAIEPDSEEVEIALEDVIESVLGDPLGEAVVEEAIVEEPEAVVEEELVEEPNAVVEEERAEEPEAVVEEAIVEEELVEEAVAEEPEAAAAPKPQGMVKLTKQEAAAMFAAMDRAKSQDQDA